jgi:hypothetical protein
VPLRRHRPSRARSTPPGWVEARVDLILNREVTDDELVHCMRAGKRSSGTKLAFSRVIPKQLMLERLVDR